MSKTNYLANAVLDFWLRGNPNNLTPPGTVYVGLFSAVSDPDTPSVTELTGSGYARQAATFGATTAGNGTSRRTTNSAAVTFGPATGTDWPQAIAFGVFDALTAGNMLYEGTLAVPKTVQVDDSASFAIDTLIVEED